MVSSSDKNIVITLDRFKALKEELYQLINVERVQVTTDIKAAREQGDLSENADYEAARERQSQIENRILQIQQILNHSHQTKTHSDHKAHSQVQIGDQIVIYNSLIQKEVTVQILGRLDADPFKKIISNESPLAQAVIGKNVGSAVLVRGPKQNFQVKILQIL